MPPPQRPRQGNEAEVRVGWKMAGIGVEVATMVIGGAGLGWLIDRGAGTGQTWTTVGALAGIVIGLWTLVKGSLKLNAQLERQHPTKGRGEPIPYPDDAAEAEGDAADEPADDPGWR